MKALYYGDTNIGNIRPKNEDAFVLKEVWEALTFLRSALTASEVMVVVMSQQTSLVSVLLIILMT